jgi:hypothetical protein
LLIYILHTSNVVLGYIDDGNKNIFLLPSLCLIYCNLCDAAGLLLHIYYPEKYLVLMQVRVCEIEMKLALQHDWNFQYR